MMDDRISGGVRRFAVPDDESTDFEVTTREGGRYPYVVLVLADHPILAEGSALPVFWVDP